MEIRIDDLSGPEIASLLQEHLQSAALHSPPESIHALDIEGLKKPGVTFWSVWEGAELLGCGALKEIDARHVELKSMRIVASHLRKGIGGKLLMHILEEARERGYHRISLETGSMDAFAPARKLYTKFGFSECGPFADYRLDPYSIFMTKLLHT